MKPSIRTPAAALAVALGVLLVAVVLDRGSPGSRDAALVVGSLALYALIPAAATWLAVAAVRRSASRVPAHVNRTTTTSTDVTSVTTSPGRSVST